MCAGGGCHAHVAMTGPKLRLPCNLGHRLVPPPSPCLQAYANRVRAKVVKNKVASPHK